MKKHMKLTPISANGKKTDISAWSMEAAEKVFSFHQSIPEYRQTPLRKLNALAKELHVEGIYIKDESFRFGLNAFKVLGGSYAVARYIGQRAGIAEDVLSYEYLTGDEAKKSVGNKTFITATDGNHGRGIAWAANRLGCRCIVYMPAGSSKERLEHIRKENADAFITNLSYDDAVRKAADDAAKHGYVLMQDTAWEGYEEIPKWIMQGYMTMAYEVRKQIKEAQIPMPTHLFLQAGVGAMSGALTAFFANLFGEKRDKLTIIIVEPEKADCIFRTAKANDGRLHAVTSEMDTIMAGLACGEPCTTGWNIIRDYADYAAAVSDNVAAGGMRILGNPMDTDARIISGESGAAAFGMAVELLTNPDYISMKNRLKIDESSVILCFSTEGDTDRESYKKIVWDGAYPSF